MSCLIQELYYFCQECSPTRSLHVTTNIIPNTQANQSGACFLFSKLLGLSLPQALTNQVLGLYKFGLAHHIKVFQKRWNKLTYRPACHHADPNSLFWRGWPARLKESISFSILYLFTLATFQRISCFSNHSAETTVSLGSCMLWPWYGPIFLTMCSWKIEAVTPTKRNYPIIRIEIITVYVRKIRACRTCLNVPEFTMGQDASFLMGFLEKLFLKGPWKFSLINSS